MLLKDFRTQVVSVLAVIVILIAGFFNQTKDAILFQPGAVPSDNPGKQSMEMSKSPKRLSPKEADFIDITTEDQYITEGQRFISPNVRMRDGFHMEIGNKNTTNYNDYH